ncbi:hypothetical protein [Candidatus Palauibacter sp.]|uniref:hypothetical protein n=1 Tax=Candidatus Palauibacter sp. TaxID=3101350 RepID=UPI003D1323A1
MQAETTAGGPCRAAGRNTTAREGRGVAPRAWANTADFSRYTAAPLAAIAAFAVFASLLALLANRHDRIQATPPPYPIHHAATVLEGPVRSPRVYAVPAPERYEEIRGDPDITPIAVLVRSGQNTCLNVLAAGSAMAMLEQVYSFQTGAGGGAYETIDTSGPVRLNPDGTVAMRAQSSAGLPYMLYGMAIFRDCVVRESDRWTLVIRVVDDRGATFAEMDASGRVLRSVR